MMSRRFIHFTKIISSSSVQSSSLAKLRKSTGYSMSNCKKALQLHVDLTKAEEWLHQEAKRQGWSKIANLEQKSAAQGLIGICVKNSTAAMVEVNCETDFVARNIEFQSFVNKVLISCLNHTFPHGLTGDYTKYFLDNHTLNDLPSDSTTLGDLVASAVGKFGEKTVIRRAVCFKVANNIRLSSFTHPSVASSELAEASMGKYGGVIAFSPNAMLSDMNEEFFSNVGRQICQHIVGMNPTTLGNMKDVQPLAKKLEITNEEFGAKIVPPDQREDIVLNDNPPEGEHANTAESEHANTPEGEHADEEAELKDESKLVDTNENRLFHQQFLLDPNICVGEFLLKNSIEVIDFHRFECGEIIQ